MKYLKRYNETYDLSAQCEELTGYPISELESIFEINLEDNTEFDVARITTHLMPHNMFNAWNEDLGGVPVADVDRDIVYIELTGDFSNNKEMIAFNANYEDRQSINNKEKLVLAISKKSLNVIGRKYDLKIGNILLRDILDNDEFRIGFTVEKDTTAQ